MNRGFTLTGVITSEQIAVNGSETKSAEITFKNVTVTNDGVVSVKVETLADPS